MENYRESLGGRVLVAAHRGVAGGNVPCNSLLGYRGALRQGADIVELDVSRSLDGTLYAFHPCMEPRFLRSEKYHIDPKSTLGILAMMYSARDHMFLDTGSLEESDLPRFLQAIDGYIVKEDMRDAV